MNVRLNPEWVEAPFEGKYEQRYGMWVEVIYPRSPTDPTDSYPPRYKKEGDTLVEIWAFLTEK